MANTRAAGASFVFSPTVHLAKAAEADGWSNIADPGLHIVA